MKLPELKFIFIAELVLFALLVTPVFVLAQVEDKMQGVELSLEDGVPAQVQEPRSDPGFNPMWLLPLLILPLLYTLYRRYDAQTEDEPYATDVRYRPEVAYHTIIRKRQNTAK